MTVGVPRTVMTRTFAGWYVTSPRACATVAVAHSTATSATVPSASRSRIGTPTAHGDRIASSNAILMTSPSSNVEGEPVALEYTRASSEVG